jgi:hypothetical protein
VLRRSIPQIRLAANEDDGDVRTADRSYFFYPLYGDVVQTIGRVDGKSDEDDVRFRVA